MITVGELITKLERFPKDAIALGFGDDEYDCLQYHIEEPYASKTNNVVYVTIDEDDEYVDPGPDLEFMNRELEKKRPGTMEAMARILEGIGK